jgi:hypothetical protein
MHDSDPTVGSAALDLALSLLLYSELAYRRIVNGDFGGETDNPADPASILVELPEGCTDDLGPVDIPSGINGDFGGECGDPVDVPSFHSSAPDER